MPSSSPDDFDQPYRFQGASGQRWTPGLGGYSDATGNVRVAELSSPQKSPLFMPEGGIGIPSDEPYDGFHFTEEGLYLDANGRQLPRQGPGYERGIAALARLKTAATIAANANPIESARSGFTGYDCWGDRMGYLDRGLSLAGAFPAFGAVDDGARLGKNLWRAKYTAAEAKKLRKQANALWENHGKLKPKDYHVHHMETIEWNHIVGGDPNRIENLVAIHKDRHYEINSVWNSFRSKFRQLGRDPRPEEILEQVRLINEKFGQYYIR